MSAEAWLEADGVAHLAAAEPTRQSPLLCDSTPPDWWIEREVQKDDDLRETLLDLLSNSLDLLMDPRFVYPPERGACGVCQAWLRTDPQAARQLTAAEAGR